ncbi:Nucleoside recognition [Geobacillus sp. BCO2]|nr:Nucleoside recognition [Geobacillus sp. BCO2]
MTGMLQRGVLAGLKTSWALGKIIFPVTLILALLQPTPLFSWIIDGVAPLMKWFGLSGDAAVPLVLGNLLGLYAAIGAMLTIELTVKEVFILAVMLSFSHNLIVESSVASRTGMSVWLMIVVRVGLAVVSGLLIAHFWNGGQEIAQYGFVTHEAAPPSGWGEIILAALKKAAAGIVQLVAIVIPLMTVIQILKERHWIEAVSRWMAPATRMLGMSANTSLTLAAGFVFGLGVRGGGDDSGGERRRRLEARLDAGVHFSRVMSCGRRRYAHFRSAWHLCVAAAFHPLGDGGAVDDGGGVRLAPL